MATVTASVSTMLTRELRALERELEAYPDDASIWQLPAGAPNSAGTLTLHLAGNVQHFIGATLGKTGYVRDREAEFSRRDVPRDELLTEVAAAIAAVERTFAHVGDEVLDDEYQAKMGPYRTETCDALIHLLAHFAYHLGQIDYHRRLVTESATGVNAIAPGEMLSARKLAV